MFVDEHVVLLNVHVVCHIHCIYMYMPLDTLRRSSLLGYCDVHACTHVHKDLYQTNTSDQACMHVIIKRHQKHLRVRLFLSAYILLFTLHIWTGTSNLGAVIAMPLVQVRKQHYWNRENDTSRKPGRKSTIFKLMKLPKLLLTGSWQSKHG